MDSKMHLRIGMVLMVVLLIGICLPVTFGECYVVDGGEPPCMDGCCGECCGGCCGECCDGCCGAGGCCGSCCYEDPECCEGDGSSNNNNNNNNRSLPIAADPVFIRNGEFRRYETDVSIPGRVLTVQITRTYGSRREYNSPFGYGWDINYNLRVRRLYDPNTIILINGKGCRFEYTRDANDPNLYLSSYHPTEYFDYDDVNDTFVLVRKDLEYHFDTDDKLSSIKDRNGNSITFEYTQDEYGHDLLLPLYGPSDFFLDEQFGGPTGGRGLVAMVYRLIKITDDLGRNVNLSYNQDGLLDTITDFANRSWDYTYDPCTNDLLAVTSPGTDDYPDGIVTIYSYDTKHNLECIYDHNDQQLVVVKNYYDANDMVYKQDVGDGSYQFQRDDQNNAATITDREGFETKMVYNDNGQLLSRTVYTADPQSNPNSFTTTYVYDANTSKRTRIIFPAGNCIDYTHDDLAALTGTYKKTGPSEPNDANDPDVIAFTYTYDPNFDYKVKTIIDAMGRVTTYDYNEVNGNLEKITYPEIPTADGNKVPTESYTYNSFGQIETVTAPDGMVTKYVYYSDSDPNDPNCGKLWKVIVDYGTDPNLNLTTEYSYDAFGNIGKIKDPNGNETESVYNELNQLVEITDPAGNVTTFSYDKNGNQSKVEREITGQTNQITTYTYNTLNKLVKVTDPLGNITTYGYTKNEDPNITTDAENNSTISEYNERGLLIEVTDANAGVTQYSYDYNGSLAEIKDPNNNTTAYTYDGFDRLICTTYPDDTNEVFSYDKNSNITSKKNRKGQTISYQYDAMNRQTVKSRPNDPDIIIRYDIAGRVYDVNDDGDVIQYTHDRIGRVNDVDYYGQWFVGYQYDSRGLRTKLVYPDSSYVTYEYDSLSRLTKIKDQDGNSIAEYTYDQLSRRTLLTLGSDANAVYEYDLADRLKKLTNNLDDTNSIVFDYANYDKVGNRLNMKIDDANAHIYTYDVLYQLTNVDYNDGNSTDYYYDVLGNRTGVVNGGTTSYSSNSLNQYTSVGGTGYSYDDNGNLTDDGQYEYYYDCENRLIDVNENSSAVASYSYDYKGRRISKTVGGTTTKYCYDGDPVVAEYEGDTLVHKFIYGPGIDEPICMIDVSDNNKIYYYHFDGLGSVAALSDNSADIVEGYSYDVFGEPNRVSDVNNPYLFTGRRYDAEAGLYYYRARYYYPNIGRFLQTDPIGYYDSMNLYTYVGNNPVNRVDPLGLMACSECQDRYRNALAKVAADAAECHNDCGPSSLGPSVALCVMSCAKTGLYFPVCLFACGAASQAPWAFCHYCCARMEHENIAAITFAYNLCMSDCCP